MGKKKGGSNGPKAPKEQIVKTDPFAISSKEVTK